MDVESRFFGRFVMSGTIMVQVEAGGVTKTVNGELIDLSFKGCGFFCAEPLKKGDLVDFLLINHGLGVRLKGEGKVVFMGKASHKGKEIYRCGMEFSRLDSEVLRDIVLGLQKSGKKSLK